MQMRLSYRRRIVELPECRADFLIGQTSKSDRIDLDSERMKDGDVTVEGEVGVRVPKEEILLGIRKNWVIKISPSRTSKRRERRSWFIQLLIYFKNKYGDDRKVRVSPTIYSE
jgi:hypothetical protein